MQPDWQKGVVRDRHGRQAVRDRKRTDSQNAVNQSDRQTDVQKGRSSTDSVSKLEGRHKTDRYTGMQSI